MFGFDLLGMIAGIPGLIIAMVVHEYAHARTAVAMGDFTPRMMGRLTLNPAAHVDPVGLIMLLVARFGWAKPVIINPRNFKNWRRGELLVALAGPGANLLTAFLTVVALGVYLHMGMPLTRGVRMVVYLIIIYNINFAIFNMIPLPPLDGSKVLFSVIKESAYTRLMMIEQYGSIILFALFATGILGRPVSALVSFLYGHMLPIAQWACDIVFNLYK